MRAIIMADASIQLTSGDVGLHSVEIHSSLAGLPISRLAWNGEAIVDAETVTTWWIGPNGNRRAFKAAADWQPEPAPDLPAALAAVKSLRKAAIDAEAERQRLRWITPGAGQAMTYQAKVDEARALAVDGEDADPSHYPMLSAEIGITAATLQDVAGVVIAAYQQWQMLGAAIEAARLGAKRAVDLAATAAEVEAVSVNWPNS